MPSLTTEGGKPVDVSAEQDAINDRFRQAMNDDGPAEDAPPRREPGVEPTPGDAPKPRRGRPRKEDQSRTAKVTQPPKDDYTADAQGLVGAVWTAAAAIPYTQPYALIVESNSDALAGALAEGAKHNSTIRAFVDSGKSSWMLALAGVGLNMGMQAWQMAKDPVLQEKARAVTVEHLKAALGANGIQVEENDSEQAVRAAA